MNIFLAIYCRKLNPDVRIISRITHERNLEAIHRAGADFVLSYNSLGVKSLLALLHHREPVVLGEGADLFTVPVPPSLAGKSLAVSAIGARTGLHVIAIQADGKVLTNPPAESELPSGGELVVIGTGEQRAAYSRLFSGKGARSSLAGKAS
jgi:Trk K+ transport system NAD-binding subunit